MKMMLNHKVLNHQNQKKKEKYLKKEKKKKKNKKKYKNIQDQQQKDVNHYMKVLMLNKNFSDLNIILMLRIQSKKKCGN
jgi:ssDNA-specific exonuclease RecJ